MAQIDTSMYNQLKPVQIENPLAQYAQLAQVQSAQNQNKLAELAFGEKQREVNENRLLGDAYKSALKPDGTIDRTTLYSGLAQGGLGTKIPGVQKGFADQDKSQREAEKAQIEGHLKKFEAAGQIMAPVKDQASWTIAKQQTAQVFGAEAAAQMPDVYDPALVEQKRAQAMTVKDQLEQMWKQKGYDLDVSKFGYQQQNDAQNRQVTVRGQDISASTALRGQNMSSETARRGQDMTDSRTREFNDTKVEENKIKREAKDETANLTKSSQIASFDTMLGTLDRLGKHPGLSRSVGAIGAFPTMPGSDSANFQAELNTFQSQAFLPMVAQLKGMGALSDAEGKKLTAAVGALDPKMGEKAFRESVSRITADMESARKRMVGGASKNTPKVPATEPAAAGIVSVTTAEDYAKVPSGATYTTPDGSTRRKP